RRLGLHGPDCIAFEDSANGLRAARAARVPTIVTPTAYTADHSFEGALVVLPHLGDPHAPILSPSANERPAWVDLDTLRRWHREAFDAAHAAAA
ncbi:HAD family hydrolase, partial [Mesorhizobium sp. M00.F.Ca.ET.216.01.1.1]